MAARKHEIDQYMAHRPEYPPTLWALFTTYHQGALQKAHDIGSGFGNGMEGLLSLLASREQGNLSHAILTEPKQFLVEAASASLPPRFPNTKFAWRNKKGEDSWDAPLGLQEGELDLAMSCEAIHWTILETSLENVHRSLRTNGTFAAVLYAPLPNIVGNLAATKILQSLVQDHVQELIASGWMDEGWKRCMRQLYSGLSDLPLAGGKWKDVKLIELNCPDGWWRPDSFEATPSVMNGAKKMATGENGDSSHPVAQVERIRVPVDANWRRTVPSSEWVKEMLISFQLKFSEETWSSNKWKELETLLKGQPVCLEWPVHIVLARKR